MRLLLDTHVLLWLFKEPDRLSLTTHDRLAESETEILVSVATLWEIAIKRAVGKLNLPGDLVQIVPRFVREIGADLLTISPAHALSVADLPMHHRDPFDRLLIAQAHIEKIPIVTADRSFAAYDIEAIRATG